MYTIVSIYGSKLGLQLALNQILINLTSENMLLMK